MAGESGLRTVTKPPAVADHDGLRRLAGFLHGVGFTDRGIAAALGHQDTTLTTAPAVDIDEASAAPLQLAVRLFVTAHPVDAGALERALPPGIASVLHACGLISVEHGRAFPLVRLVAHDGLLVASDVPFDPEGRIPADHVMGVSSSTTNIASFMVRRSFRRALDVGTGSGLLGLLTARHTEAVVGVDSNERALAFARFNAALNGLGNVEFRGGDRFSPVHGERFDLIVSNPPFVISPETRYVFRDAGLPGDRFVEELVREAPGHLAEGGICHIICNFANVAGEAWDARLSGWAAAPDCGAWAIRAQTFDPRAYAERWIFHEAATDPVRDDLVDAWARSLMEAGVESVSDGFFMMRRGGVKWFRADDLAADVLPPSGESVVRAFEAGDYLAETSDPGLLDAALRPAPDAILERRHVADGGAWRGAGGTLRLLTGLRYVGDVEGAIAGVVAGCDGARPLRELLSGAAADIGADVDTVARVALPSIRVLIERGFLLPPRSAT